MSKFEQIMQEVSDILVDHPGLVYQPDLLGGRLSHIATNYNVVMTTNIIGGLTFGSSNLNGGLKYNSSSGVSLGGSFKIPFAKEYGGSIKIDLDGISFGSPSRDLFNLGPISAKGNFSNDQLGIRASCV